MKLKRILKAVLLFAVISIYASAMAQTSGDSLETGFQTPPASAKPRVWWHWMNGNVTKAGITADFEWMKRVGIGGMQMFDANIGTPQFVDKRIVWMTPEWKDAFHHAGAEADRLGLEMAMAASGGWSETGGPWVKPQEAMKKVAWSETDIRGSKQFIGKLPLPPAQTLYRDKKDAIPFFKDTRVLAFRVPEAEVKMAALHPKVTSSKGAIDASALMDGDTSTATRVFFAADATEAWIQFEFTKPFRAQALTIADSAPSGIPASTLRASLDGKTWVTLATLPGPGYADIRTFSFPATTARYYRLVLDRPGALALKEFELSSTPRVRSWYDKAQYAEYVIADYQSLATPAIASADAIAPASVVDVTARMRPDGTLTWTPPAGRWLVLRMGYTLTGATDYPASPEATGLEVDKLSRQHVESYFQHYIGLLSGALGPSFGTGFRYLLMDSWEAGTENWTEDMITEFRKRRGYDPVSYLPVLTGRVVGSADASDRFLWDFRRTLADLLADNHYGVATSYLQQKGLAGLYAEAMGIKLPTTGDGLQNKGKVSIPMGEFWVRTPEFPGFGRDEPGDLREAASAAHIYAKGIAAAESFTTQRFLPEWGQGPFNLKRYADWAMALGINRFVIHTSVHQPFTDDVHKPGITLGGYGQHYTRNNTWGEQSVAFNTYLARSSHLLQQGLFVGDLLYYYGEGAPVAVLSRKLLQPAPPAGYNYDWMNTDVLLNRLTVRDRRLVLPDGMSYRVLVLPADVNQLTLPVLRKLRDLVAAGATIIAPRPMQSPSLAGYPAIDDSVRSIANDVWGTIDGVMVTSHVYGNGMVFWGQSVQQVLDAVNTPPDFVYSRPVVDDTLVWIHRRADDMEIYFVANQRNRPMDCMVQFRVAGKEAELWHPDNGDIEPSAYTIEQGHTNVPLHLDPFGSTFVIFRKPAAASSRTLPHWIDKQLATVSGLWTITFPPNWGAPASIRLDSLLSWTASHDDGVKYFSGTATYAKDIDAPGEWLQTGSKILLDLGVVKEIAEVSVNGHSLGILWKPPFRADITGALQPGKNHIEIRITNLWPNRIIGDRQPGVTKTYTFSDFKAYKKDSPLLESGLLGPVRIVARTKAE